MHVVREGRDLREARVDVFLLVDYPNRGVTLQKAFRLRPKTEKCLLQWIRTRRVYSL